jgi:pyoverdine/dityrosine biosynthesis protein Dit1
MRKTDTYQFERPMTRFRKAKEQAEGVLELLEGYRRVSNTADLCELKHCSHCQAHFMDKITSSIELGMPIEFVLPAFPGKSPNLNKVLGVLPDRAEFLSLKFLNQLCLGIANIYPPGGRIKLCSDGRVFSDIVGIRENDITAYQKEIEHLIFANGFNCLSCFHLDDYFTDRTFDQMRILLMEGYGQELEYLQKKVHQGKMPDANREQKQVHRMYRGMVKFLYEDSLFPGQTHSKSQLQKKAREAAYQVINRSNAWSGLIAELFPKALRLSIHPQGCGTGKLGIKLVGEDSWMTPWHGVALESQGRFSLVKRKEAVELGARLVFGARGAPSHFVLEAEYAN